MLVRSGYDVPRGTEYYSKTLAKVLEFNRCIFIVHHDGGGRMGEPGTIL